MQREREIVYPVVHSQIAGPGRSQEPGAPSESPTWVRGGLRIFPSAFPGTVAGRKMGSRAAGTHTAVVLRDTTVKSSG